MVGLGTTMLNGASGKEAILAALRAGYRLIDTAQAYENEGRLRAPKCPSRSPQGLQHLENLGEGNSGFVLLMFPHYAHSAPYTPPP